MQERGRSGQGSVNWNTLEAARKVKLKPWEHRTRNTKTGLQSRQKNGMINSVEGGREIKKGKKSDVFVIQSWQLQEHIDQLNESCETYSMKISTSKTEVMTVSKRPDKLDININGTQLKQTNEFKYLGSMFTENGKLDREIETRCQKANAVSYQLAPLLKHPSISTSTKAKLINAIFLPTLTYQCQTWSLTKDLERKLVTCEMKCLRKAVNKTKRDKIRNEVIRDMAGAKPVLQHIKQQQVKWFGHITRMSINQPALRAYNTKYSGWRARGRPRKRWSDSVADTLRTQGMSLLRDAYRYKRKKKSKVKVK